MAMVTRLVGHKGVDLVQAIAEGLQQGIELVILGSGEAQYENFFNELCARNPGRVGVYIGFNAKLAQQIYAGADIFPDAVLLEPCGLAQMVSCRYGTIPVIRDRRPEGTLSTTPGDGHGNGFTFLATTTPELYGSLLARQGRLLAEGRLACAGQARHGVRLQLSNSPRATRAVQRGRQPSGNLFIKCGLSSKGRTAFFVEKAVFFKIA